MFFDEEKICPICNKVFMKDRHRAAKKYCSPACSVKAGNLKKQEYYRQNKEAINNKSADLKKIAKRKSNKKYSNSKEIARIDMLAKKEGLNYGQYVAKYGV